MSCDESTPCCPEMQTLPPGAMIPSCCQVGLTELAKRASAAMLRGGIYHWLDWGSLLGVIRSGSLIPWDRDVDFGVWSDQLKALSMVNWGRLRYVESGGPDYSGKGLAPFPRIYLSETNGLYADVYVWDRDGHEAVMRWEDHEFRCPAAHYDIHIVGRLGGTKLPVPSLTEAYLKLRYGADWRTPDPLFYQRGRRAR